MLSRESQSAKRARISDDTETSALVRRGMIRYMYVIVDLSKAMEESDIRPTRMTATVEVLMDFIRAFYEDNPLSNLGILYSKAGTAKTITYLSGSPKIHLKAAASMKTTGEGDFSLQNALELAYTSLASIPQYGSREILVIQASLSTCDPGDIFETIDKLAKEKIRCSFVGLAAETHICKYTASKTNGKYSVVRDKTHLRNVVLSHIIPPVEATAQGERVSTKCSFVEMGFPSQAELKNGVPQPAICADTGEVSTKGYYCPRCKSVASEIPSECKICMLNLIASPHLARSYHHLFPVPRFKVKVLDKALDECCEACVLPLQKSSLKESFQCPRCQACYCESCDDLIHDTLHNCPSCLQFVMGRGVSTDTMDVDEKS
uniref:VWFA domain-containing protein n=1 Tax=Aplanochytrium stocchinoi TaxID=215587 RepID=A0A7S3PG79_9STRA